MGKDLSVSVLLDFYGDLLTGKQRDALDLYYNKDFSLAEIAENSDISRQGVRDFLVRGEKQLREYDKNLDLVKKYSDIKKISDDIRDIIKKSSSASLGADRAQISALLDKINEII